LYIHVLVFRLLYASILALRRYTLYFVLYLVYFCV
jgi:hypothetical protein